MSLGKRKELENTESSVSKMSKTDHSDLDTFWNWMNSTGMSIDKRLVFKTGSTGRGVWTTDEIEKKAVLFKIPFKNILCADNSNCPFPEYSESLDGEDWAKLSIIIMYEYSLVQNSNWFHYLHGYLPLSLTNPPTQFAPIFWNDENIDKLKGTESYQTVIEQKKQLDALWSASCDWMNSKPELPENFGKYFNKDFFSYIFFIVQSYSFTLDRLSFPSEIENPKLMTVMCPMADALNHQTGSNNARLFTHEKTSYDSDEDISYRLKPSNILCYEMLSIKPIRKDEEVFNTYGDLANHELFEKYGFLDKKNPNNFITFSMEDLLFQIALLEIPSLTDAQKKLVKEDLKHSETKSSEKDIPKSYWTWKSNVMKAIESLSTYAMYWKSEMFEFSDYPNLLFLLVPYILLEANSSNFSDILKAINAKEGCDEITESVEEITDVLDDAKDDLVSKVLSNLISYRKQMYATGLPDTKNTNIMDSVDSVVNHLINSELQVLKSLESFVKNYSVKEILTHKEPVSSDMEFY